MWELATKLAAVSRTAAPSAEGTMGSACATTAVLYLEIAAWTTALFVLGQGAPVWLLTTHLVARVEIALGQSQLASAMQHAGLVEIAVVISTALAVSKICN